MCACAVAGDVNIFLNDHDEAFTAEIEIMVAEPARCGPGQAEEAEQSRARPLVSLTKSGLFKQGVLRLLPGCSVVSGH